MGKPPTVGRRWKASKGSPLAWATPPGTGNAGALLRSAWPILWRARVASSRRNARKGVGRCCRQWLKVRANPLGNQAFTWRPDRSKCGRDRTAISWSIWYIDLNAVMPLDVLGRTRATLTGPASTSPWPRGLGNLVKPCRAGDRALQLLLFNEECLVSTSHQLVLITSLPFVHTARRYYRLNGSVRPSDWLREVGNDRPEPESWSNLVI